MRAVLLCAGFATRMYPLTEDVAKPLLAVAGRPVLDYLMDQLVSLPSLEAIHLVTNARFYPQFVEWRQDWQTRLSARLPIHIYDDGATDNSNRRGAVGDLAFVLRRMGCERPALVAAGDNIFRFSLQPLWQRFSDERCNLVVGLRERNPARRQKTGVLEFGDGDVLIGFHEKPASPPSEWICPALYFLQPEALRAVFDYMEGPEVRDAPGHFIAYLVQQQRVHGVRIDGTRFDIGSHDSYRLANDVLASEPVIM